MVARKTAPEGFDIIIDDASHFGDLTKIAFWHLLYNHLKPSGLYVIEDWGTGSIGAIDLTGKLIGRVPKPILAYCTC